MESICYVSKAMEQFPYGSEHSKIMEKVMKKRELEDKRN